MPVTVPGALEYIDRQVAAAVPLFVAFATPETELTVILDRRDLRTSFRGAYGAPRSKPAIVADILQARRGAPAQWVFVGDTLSDWKTAQGAGACGSSAPCPQEVPTHFPQA